MNKADRKPLPDDTTREVKAEVLRIGTNGTREGFKLAERLFELLPELSMAELNPELIRRYFETRLPNERFTSKAEVVVHCCFHDDRTSSLSLGSGKGHLELLCRLRQWWHGFIRDEVLEVRRTCGQDKHHQAARRKASVFQGGAARGGLSTYHDARGVLVFEKLRYPGKRFSQRRPTGKGGYEYKLGSGR